MSTTTRPRRSKSKAKGTRGPAAVTPAEVPYRPDVAVVEACASSLNAAIAYCLTRGGEHVEEHHLKSLFDCMEVCQLTASLVSRGSRYGEGMVGVCAEACRDVAQACARFEEDATMQSCASAARRAEAWCRK